MPILSTCPECSRQVTVPDGLAADATVRCPLCSAEYALADVLAAAPPPLIPVDAAAVAPVPATPAAEPATSTPEQASELEQEVTTAEAEAEAEPEAPADDAPQLDVWQKADEMPSIDLGDGAATPVVDTGHTPVDTGAFAGFSEQEQAEQGAPGSVAAGMARRRKRQKEKNIGAELVKAVVGGFLGLIIGYYLLNLIGGARFDWFDVYLPFVNHTRDHWPFDGDDQRGDPSAASTEFHQSNDAKNARGLAPSTGPAATQSTTPATAQGQPDAAGPTTASVQPPAETPAPEPTSRPPPDAEPLPEEPRESPAEVGPKDPPSFDTDELGRALKAAHDSLLAPEGTSPEFTGVTAESYAGLCELGHVAAFVADDPGSSKLTDLRLGVGKVLRDLGHLAGQTGEIADHADMLLLTPGGPQGGILLAGTVTGVKVSPDNGLQGSVVQLTGKQTTVAAMARPALEIQPGDEVLLLGSVVNVPAENFIGYHGNRKLLVWAAAAEVIGH